VLGWAERPRVDLQQGAHLVGDVKCHTALGDLPARAQPKAEEVTEIERCGRPQGEFGFIEARVPTVQTDVDRVPRRHVHPGQECGRALHHPRLGLGDRDAGKEPIIGELTPEAGELRPGPSQRQPAELVCERLAQCRRIAVATFSHAGRASAIRTSRSREPARCSTSSRSAGPSPRPHPNRYRPPGPAISRGTGRRTRRIREGVGCGIMVTRRDAPILTVPAGVLLAPLG